MTNARGVTIHVGSVGFLHVSDLLVTFASGPIESVRVDDLLYTGQMVTLLTWLYEFVSKRLRGARLRDEMPVVPGDEPRSDAKRGGGETAPETESRSLAETTARRGAVLRQNSLAAATPANRAPDAVSPGSPSTRIASGDGFPADHGGHASMKSPEDSGERVRAKASPADPRRSFPKRSSLNVPVLAAGVFVTLRRRPSRETAPKDDVPTRRFALGVETSARAGGADDAAAKTAASSERSPPLRRGSGANRVVGPSENAKTSTRDADDRDDLDDDERNALGFKTRFATWQLVKGCMRFLEVTATEVSVDARGSGLGFERVAAERVALVSRIRPSSTLVVASTDRVTVREAARETADEARTTATRRERRSSEPDAEPDAEPPETSFGARGSNATDGGERERASFRDGRLDVTLRYASREGRVAVAEAALTAASAEVAARADDDDDVFGGHGDDGRASDDDDDDDDLGDDEEKPRAAGARSVSPTATFLTRAARAVPARLTVRVGVVRVREAPRRSRRRARDGHGDAAPRDAARLALETRSLTIAAERRRRKPGAAPRAAEADARETRRRGLASAEFPSMRVDARWSRIELGVIELGSEDDGDDADGNDDSTAAGVTAAGGAARLDLPLPPLDEAGDDADARGPAAADAEKAPSGSSSAEASTARENVVTAHVRADIGSLDARVTPDLVLALRRAFFQTRRRPSRAGLRGGVAGGASRARSRLVLQTTCRLFGGARVRARAADSETPRFETRAETVELGVNVLDDRATHGDSRREPSADDPTPDPDPTISASGSGASAFDAFAGRGVVVAEDVRWSPTAARDETSVRRVANDHDSDDSDGRFRASRFEMRRFGDARDVVVVDAEADLRAEALPELEAGFHEAFAALAATVRGDAPRASDGTAAKTTAEWTREDDAREDEPKKAETRFGFPALAPARRSRLAFADARLRARVDATPETRGGVPLDRGGVVNDAGPRALVASARRLVAERHEGSRAADAGETARRGGDSETRVDARGLVLTYADAAEDRSSGRAGSSPDGGAGSAEPATLADDADDRGSEGETTETNEARRRRGGDENVVSLATARSASARLVVGSRFPGNSAAEAAAGVTPAQRVTCDGARCRWDPDAHFALLRVRAAWAQMAERRARRERRRVSDDVSGKPSNGTEEDSPFSGNSERGARGGPGVPSSRGGGSSGEARVRLDVPDPLAGSEASVRSRRTPSGVSGAFPETFDAGVGVQFGLSGNAGDGESGSVSARTATGDGATGGDRPSDTRPSGSSASSASAASSARSEPSARGASGTFPEPSVSEPSGRGDGALAKPNDEARVSKRAREVSRRDDASRSPSSMTVRLTDAQFEADIASGARFVVEAASADVDPRRRALECARVSAAVNGRVVFAAVAAAVAVGDTVGGVVGGGDAVGVAEGAARTTVDVTASSPRLALPHGLDLGDAALAAQTGADEFRAFLRGADAAGLGLGCRVKRRPLPLRDLEITLRTVGSLVAEAFDAPLARCLRVKQAALEPELARARARDAARLDAATDLGSEDTARSAEATSRLEAFVAASRAARRRADGAAFAEDAAADGTGEAKAPNIAEAVERGAAVSAAGAVTLGHGSVVSCVFAGDARRAETAAAAFVGRVTEAERASAASRETSKHPNETPERDASAFAAEIKRAFVTSCDLRDVAIRVPGAPAPLFAAKRLEVVGPVVQARAPVPKPAVAAAPAEGRTMTETDGKTPRHAPVATFTDVDVRSTAARVCYAVHCEPALVSFARELLRLTPPPRGGRDAAAARVAAAWREAARAGDWRGFDTVPGSDPGRRARCVHAAVDDDDDPTRTRLCAPALPFWDVARSLWRGKARVSCADAAATLDADAGYFTARNAGRFAAADGRDRDPTPAPGGGASGCRVLEVSASEATFDFEPGVATVNVARLAVAAKGGLGGFGARGGEAPRAQTGSRAERAESASDPSDPSPSLPADVQLAVIPAATVVVEHGWRTLADGGSEAFGFGDAADVAARFGVGVNVAVRATLTAEDAAAARARRQAAPAPNPSEPLARDTDGATATARAAVGATPVASRAEEGVVATPATTGERDDSDPNRREDASSRDDSRPPRCTASPRSPATARFETVSSAAAASVADASTTPTLIAGPAAIRWARFFFAAVANPPGARRRAWTTPTRSPTDVAFKKPRHPLARSLPKLLDVIDVTVTADQLRAAHPAERPDDPARGLTAHASRARARFVASREISARLRASSEEARVVSATASDAKGVLRDVANEHAARATTERIASFRVDSEEIRVLLPPPSGGGGDFGEATPTTPNAPAPGTRRATGSSPQTPGSASSGGSAARRFFSGIAPTGDFDEEAARYEAVVAMLSGNVDAPAARLDAARERRNDRDARGVFDGGKRETRRPRATDPALVLETRSVTVSRNWRAEAEAEAEAAGARGSAARATSATENEDARVVRVRVASPRLLKAAARRDALVRWARDAWRAATAPETPNHSVSSLETLVAAAAKREGEARGGSGDAASAAASLASSRSDASSTPTVATTTPAVAKTKDDARDRRFAPRETLWFVVDVVAPQVNFEGNDGTGRVLVAAASGAVVGRRVESDDASGASRRSEVKVTLEKAQAHVAPTDVDVYAGVQWLDESAFRARDASRGAESGSEGARRDVGGGGSGAARSDVGYLLRRVFEPCAMDLAFITKEPPRDLETRASARPAASRAAPRALTEFALKSPEIEAELTAEQFAALVDVVGSIFLAQLRDEPPPPAVAAARLLANTGRSLVDAEDIESAAVVAAPLAMHKEATWRLNAGLVDDAMYARRARTPSSALLACRSALLDAERATSEAVAEAEALVRPHRRRPAIALRLEIARFRWAMKAGGRSFLVARVENLSLSRERHADTSGATRLVLGDLKLDVPAPASALRGGAGGASKKPRAVVFAKPVFARWDPDAPEEARPGGGFTASRAFAARRSPERDARDEGRDDAAADASSSSAETVPLVSVDAARAASPPEAPVWDAIEVSVEPFALNLERETYATLARYLFPEKIAGDDDARPSRAGPGRDAAAAAEAEANARAMLLGVPRAERGAREGDEKKGKHARAKTWGADLFGAGAGGGGGVPTAEPKQFSTPAKPRRGRALTSPVRSRASGHASFRDPVASTLAERAPRPLPLAVDGVAAARARRLLTDDARDDDNDDGFGARDVALDVADPPPATPKVVVVKWLKVNDVALKVSYDGPPRSFHEVRLLLDASTHAAFVGRWRELIDRVKKNVVWSVLKSVTGLQGRRLPGGTAGAAASASVGETSLVSFGTRSKSIDVVVDGFEGFEGDLDFVEGLTALGSPTAAAMVAESEGLVVPASRARGASVWRRVFGGFGGGLDPNARGDARGDDRAALLSSWEKRR